MMILECKRKEEKKKDYGDHVIKKSHQAGLYSCTLIISLNVDKLKGGEKHQRS